ncbi:hypothetical protein EUGRSUZ_G01971 [Eucalyptus grandis]|uniref:Uncharacterized protein n=2 Tax=Eucalyptus grandis TaxID=71139 RepID=A0ACC3K5Q7_EUCGR|nr:hypothetical protein EUGRSUZ_G01971 [Eucalyptus grandis]
MRTLNLSNVGFNGDIPRQLNNLSKLYYLTSNNFTWVSKLSSLKYLHMSGVDLSKVKDWFGSINMLPSLQSLELSSCGLQDISSSLQANFTSLRFLNIKANSLSSIPPWIYNLSKLEHIDLSNCYGYNDFSSGIVGPFPTTIIENNQRLVFFDVSENWQHGDFPKNLSSLCKLQVAIHLIAYKVKWKIFKVSSNNFSSGLPNQLRDFKELEYLDLSSNLISGSIPANLVELLSLKKLYLNSNKLSETILESIGQLSNLTELNLGYNLLYGIVGELHFENLKSLTNLDISYNKLILNELCLDDIPNWLYDIFSNIEVSDISSNMLRGQVPQDIRDKMPQITELRLKGNNLTGGIPSSLCKSNWLHGISLSKNQLSGKLPLCWGALRIPKSLCRLSSLSVLSLHMNGFTGEIPNCLSNMPTIFVLDLSDNEFTGRLPPFGPQSPDLAVINLEKNRFVGGIPPQYCQLKYLKFLSLAQNYISGSIPNCFDGILSMANVDEAYYFFFLMFGVDVMVNTKGISQIYGITLEYFYSIDLSRNITIPSGISSIDFLSHLNLSFNRLSGPIPSGNHLRTVDDESAYRGNDRLCRAPLLNTFAGDEPPGSDGRDSDNSGGDKPSECDLDIHNWFYAGLGPGFTVGFLGFCSVLHFKGSWRVSYFQAMDKAIEKVSITMMITMLWFKRTFRRCEKELV